MWPATTSEFRSAICGWKNWRAMSSLDAANKMLSASTLGRAQSAARPFATFLFAAARRDGRFAFENRREFLEENGDEFIGFNQALDPDRGRTGRLAAEAGRSFSTSSAARRRFKCSLASPWKRRTATRSSGSSDAAAGTGAQTGFAQGAAGRQNVFLQATPIDVGPILRECLWSKLDCAVLTSATLAVGGGFDYIRQRLGFEHAREAGPALAFRLSEPGRALCSARLARSAHSAIHHQSRRAHSQTAGDHPRPRLRSLHQLCADERRLSPPSRRTGIPHAAAGQTRQKAHCWKSSGSLRMRCCLPLRRFGRAWTCRESN